ncbi:hypothetical protein P029_03670 [Anaplasma phagocytophilum str. Norway variant2]|uniref:Uncharacterized protein n=2 Tax=Anaplasma phagocytophilum TaxID=948 RepID=A0A168HEI6_ANAPH|nr:hypothetical protein [Anaplasma phagocytophilum]ANC34441.1 hypothetical protein P029_03670 [Anaplasma phagocytophilum str. Norway variant2]
MFSSINKRLGFPIFKGRTDKVSIGAKLSSLHIPESACNMGVAVGVVYVAVVILSSFLSAVYWALMAVCFVAALFLSLDYVVAACAYLAARIDLLPSISTMDDRINYSEYILKTRHGDHWYSKIARTKSEHSIENLPQTVLLVFGISLLTTFSFEAAILCAVFSALPPLLRTGTHNMYHNTATILKEVKCIQAIGEVLRMQHDRIGNLKNFGCQNSAGALCSPKNAEDSLWDTGDSPWDAVEMSWDAGEMSWDTRDIPWNTADTSHTPPHTVLKDFKGSSHGTTAYIS